jgi:hypothetical protein
MVAFWQFLMVIIGCALLGLTIDRIYAWFREITRKSDD